MPGLVLGPGITHLNKTEWSLPSTQSLCTLLKQHMDTIWPKKLWECSIYKCCSVSVYVCVPKRSPCSCLCLQVDMAL